MSASEAMAAAMRLLARRNRSEQELRTRLLRKEFAAADVETVLERCRQWGYVDDKRYALERSKSLLREGRAVGWRLRADLRQRGIAAETADDAVSQVEEGLSAQAILSNILRRRFPAFVFRLADDREKRRVFEYLLRRGFPRGLILSHFQNREDDCCHHDDR